MPDGRSVHKISMTLNLVACKSEQLLKILYFNRARARNELRDKSRMGHVLGNCSLVSSGGTKYLIKLVIFLSPILESYVVTLGHLFRRSWMHTATVASSTASHQ